MVNNLSAKLNQKNCDLCKCSLEFEKLEVNFALYICVECEKLEFKCVKENTRKEIWKHINFVIHTLTNLCFYLEKESILMSMEIVGVSSKKHYIKLRKLL